MPQNVRAYASVGGSLADTMRILDRIIVTFVGFGQMAILDKITPKRPRVRECLAQSGTCIRGHVVEVGIVEELELETRYQLACRREFTANMRVIDFVQHRPP